MNSKETLTATDRGSPGRLGEMVLIRLLADGKPPSRSDLEKALRRHFAERLAMPMAEWSELLSRTLQELHEGRYIEVKPYRLTDRGRQSALARLGVESLTPRCLWPTVKNRYVIALALGIKPQSKTEWDRLSTADGLRGAVLAKHYDLQSGPVPTVALALHELAWKQLLRAHEFEIPVGKDFTRNAVLGVTLLSGRVSNKPAETLVATVIGATGSSPDRVRDAVIARWLEAQDEMTVTVGRFNLREFAEHVKELARTADEGRFGGHKVFIGNIWNRFHQTRLSQDMTRAEFDMHLVDANRKRLLTLSRADLVEAMDPSDVRRSEIRLPDATFHFVRTDY